MRPNNHKLVFMCLGCILFLETYAQNVAQDGIYKSSWEAWHERPAEISQRFWGEILEEDAM
jgi:hypothetical protein